jgi:ribose transport system ATP-binding protein
MAPAGTLSGGNQQKLVIAKCLIREPRVLLLDEPTTGIDVGAKAELFATVAQLAAQGMSIIITSSEFEEVVAIAHRVLVLSAGREAGVLEGDARTVERVLALAFRLRDENLSATSGGAAA